MLRSKLLPLLSVLVLGFLEPVSAQVDATINYTGELIQVFGVAQQDLDGDGAPDVTIIDCAFATDTDRVLVYDQNGDMRSGNVWEEVTDFQDDLWIFDVSADGTAQLVVDFDLQSDRYVAFVYVDLDGDGQVSYRLEDDKLTIEESHFWYTKIESDHPWTQPGGLYDAVVRFSTDGFTGPEPGLSGIRGNNGEVDWEREIGDADGDGINDYSLVRAVSPYLVGYNLAYLGKATILAQVNNLQPEPYTNTVFWPLLVSKHNYEDYRYFDRPPAVAVDWVAGTIDSMGILGYPIEEGYHIYSRLPLEKHTINAANFENPMAYYDMANDQDGWPELQVRFNVAVPNDPYFGYPYNGKIEKPNVEVNYSWDQDNDNRWDYKMNLGSNYLIDEVIEFPDFAVKSVPYDEIIPWVRNRTWDVAMLVFDSRPSPDSEGMYGKGWMVNRGYAADKMVEPSGVSTRYLMGLSDSPPEEKYQDIQEGMRGEYTFQYFDTPKIYLSALDRQLHLSRAQTGVWNLGEGHRIRYANLSGDAYLDQWQEERDGEVIQQLNYGQGVYVYSGNDTVRLKQADRGPAVLETQPPGNYEEWQSLDVQVKAHQSALAPEDFPGMLDQLNGSETYIQKATVRDFLVTPQGFRFILELQPDFSVILDQADSIPLPETPGAYVVAYDGSAWSVQPATPAVLRVSDVKFGAPRGASQALRWSTLEVLLRNEGLEDVHDLPVCVTFDDQVSRQVVMTHTVALLPGKGQQSVVWDWAPAAPGTWQVRIAAYCRGSENAISDGELLGEAVVQVADTGKPSVSWLISLGERVPDTIALFLFATVAMVGAVAATWVKRSGL